jgi:hypothetical protein
MKPIVVVIALTLGAAGCSDSGSGNDMNAASEMGVGHRVFVSSLNFSGNFGGLSGADSQCVTLAGVAGIGGQWVAWMSDTTNDAIDRVKNDIGPWFRLDGTLVFANKEQMKMFPSAPIDVDENKLVTHAEGVWTGTLVGGLSATSAPPTDGGPFSANCEQWFTSGMNDTPPGPFGRSGSVDFKDKSWTDQLQVSCAQLQRIYCIEQ